MRKRYRKKEDQLVIAVQLALETPGLDYEKWGAMQHAKADDWLVNNDNDTYTVDDKTFQQSYKQISPGVYKKMAPVFAEQAAKDGAIDTLEGTTRYEAGDYVIFDDADASEGSYAISRERFEGMYELVG